MLNVLVNKYFLCYKIFNKAFLYVNPTRLKFLRREVLKKSKKYLELS